MLNNLKKKKKKKKSFALIHNSSYGIVHQFHIFIGLCDRPIAVILTPFILSFRQTRRYLESNVCMHYHKITVIAYIYYNTRIFRKSGVGIFDPSIIAYSEMITIESKQNSNIYFIPQETVYWCELNMAHALLQE